MQNDLVRPDPVFTIREIYCLLFDEYIFATFLQLVSRLMPMKVFEKLLLQPIRCSTVSDACAAWRYRFGSTATVYCTPYIAPYSIGTHTVKVAVYGGGPEFLALVSRPHRYLT